MKPFSTTPCHLSQSERLELCSGSIPSLIMGDEAPLSVTIRDPYAKPEGWTMPSAQAVRLHDARLSRHYAPPAPMDEDDSEDDDESEESELRDHVAYKRRDAMREHSFRLPSQSSRRECLGEMRALGLSWEGAE